MIKAIEKEKIYLEKMFNEKLEKEKSYLKLFYRQKLLEVTFISSFSYSFLFTNIYFYMK